MQHRSWDDLLTATLLDKLNYYIWNQGIILDTQNISPISRHREWITKRNH